MQSFDPRRGLALAALSFLTACGAPVRAVFDVSAVPSPPRYSTDFKRGLADEIAAAPRRPLIVEALTDASQFYDRIRRLRKDEGATQR